MNKILFHPHGSPHASGILLPSLPAVSEAWPRFPPLTYDIVIYYLIPWVIEIAAAGVK